MDQIAALSQEIEFHERFRGYDPDEVDVYVDRVRKMVAVALGRIAELHERAEAAEALIAAGGAGSAEETLGRTLLVAQRTADELLSEAREEAERVTRETSEHVAAVSASADDQAREIIEQTKSAAQAQLRDADDKASRVLAEAETDRREIVSNAETEATAAAIEARRQLDLDVAELVSQRAFIEDDISILERHVVEQRSNLSLVLSSLTDLVEDPESFRLRRVPATSGVVISPPVAEEIESDETAADDVEIEDLVAEPTLPDADFGETEPESAAVEEPTAESVEADEEPDELPEPELALVEDDFGSSPAESVIDLDQFDLDEKLLVEVESDEAEAPPAPPRLVTASDIDGVLDDPTVVDPGPPTAPVEPLFAEAPGAEADASSFAALADGDLLSGESDALSAFFDQEDESSDRAWFGRRR